jgi:hypothetical protein
MPPQAPSSGAGKSPSGGLPRIGSAFPVRARSCLRAAGWFRAGASGCIACPPHPRSAGWAYRVRGVRRSGAQARSRPASRARLRSRAQGSAGRSARRRRRTPCRCSPYCFATAGRGSACARRRRAHCRDSPPPSSGARAARTRRFRLSSRRTSRSRESRATTARCRVA